MAAFVIANVVTTQRLRNYANIPKNVYSIINALMVQRRRWYVGIPMNEFTMMNVVTIQRRIFFAGILMNIFCNINALMVQLGTSCSFDSPGLARNEPTPGKHPQGDSTP